MRSRHPLFLVAAIALSWLVATHASAELLAVDERESLTRALGALGARDWERASSLAQNLPEPLPTAMTWWRLAEQDDPPAPFESLARFRETRQDWPRPRALATRTEKAALSAPAADVALHLSRFPPITAFGNWAQARALVTLGDAAGATEFARAAWRESAAFTAADEAAFLSQFAAVLREEDHRARLDDLAWRGLIREAERTLPLVDDAYRRLIEARLALRAGWSGVDARIASVPRALANDPGLAYERIRWRRLADNEAGANDLLLAPPADVGEPGRWWSERRIALRGAVGDGDWRLAYRLAASHRQPRGAGFAGSEWHAGWIALRFLDRPADALAHFERMWAGVDTPISKARAAYWAGRAAAATGDPTAAARWFGEAAVFGTTFYGQEASLELGRTDFDFGSPLPERDLDGLRQSELGRLARLLAEVDDRMLLPIVAATLVRDGRDAAAIGDAIQLAQEVGRYDAAIGGYIPLYRAGVVSANASHPVPRAYGGLLQPQDLDVSAALALAIARQESRFVRNAVSPAGARGLMQLMPGTARDVARDLGLPAEVARLTRDADYNARLGTRYLGDLLRRFRDPALVAVGYNAGPRRSVEWIARNGDPRRLDAHTYIDWLELIPFGETRNYVQRIIEGERVYASLLARG